MGGSRGDQTREMRHEAVFGASIVGWKQYVLDRTHNDGCSMHCGQLRNLDRYIVRPAAAHVPHEHGTACGFHVGGAKPVVCSILSANKRSSKAVHEQFRHAVLRIEYELRQDFRHDVGNHALRRHGQRLYQPEHELWHRASLTANGLYRGGLRHRECQYLLQRPDRDRNERRRLLLQLIGFSNLDSLHVGFVHRCLSAPDGP